MGTDYSREHPLPASIRGQTLRCPSTSLMAAMASLSGQLVDSRAFEHQCQVTYETECFVRLRTGGVDSEIVKLALQSACHDRRSEGVKGGARDGHAADVPIRSLGHLRAPPWLGQSRFALDHILQRLGETQASSPQHYRACRRCQPQQKANRAVGLPSRACRKIASVSYGTGGKFPVLNAEGEPLTTIQLYIQFLIFLSRRCRVKCDRKARCRRLSA